MVSARQSLVHVTDESGDCIVEERNVMLKAYTQAFELVFGGPSEAPRKRFITLTKHVDAKAAGALEGGVCR